MSKTSTAVDFCELCENYDTQLFYDKSIGMTVCSECKRESKPPRIRKKKRHREDGED